MRRRRILRGLFLLALASLLLPVLFLFSPQLTRAAPPAQSPGQGEALFNAKCVACHTIGGGNLVGPDLKGVTTLETRDWLTRWLANPPALVASKDARATQLVAQYGLTMPNLNLSPDQVSALIDYMAAKGGGAPAPAAQPPVQPQPAAILPGNPANGKNLFAGAVALQNGGPPCIGCHAIAGSGPLGGGVLGPDLTLALSKYGDAGLANFLNTYPLPTMKAVWTNNPLTPQEQDDLRGYLEQQAPAGQATDMSMQVGGIATGITAGLFILAQLYWRKRLAGVRRPLLARLHEERQFHYLKRPAAHHR